MYIISTAVLKQVQFVLQLGATQFVNVTKSCDPFL